MVKRSNFKESPSDTFVERMLMSFVEWLFSPLSLWTVIGSFLLMILFIVIGALLS